MRVAARQNTRKTQVIRSKSIPAPVGGWNARDALAEMDETDAVVLDNWFPRTQDVKMRKGFESWVTGLPSEIETLMEHSPAGGSAKLIAASGGAIYNVTASGAVGAAIASSYSNDRWQWINFSNATANYLLYVNGQDSMRAYDGTNVTTPVITNLTSSTAIHINSHKSRVWLTESGTLSAWYLGTNAIAGAATEFDVGAFATKGGYLVGMATWTIDGGAGVDDLAVFLTSEGQAIIYKGTDPASDWDLVGVYNISRPIGRRCFIKYGGDLIIITEDGYYPLSKSLIFSRAAPQIAVSDKISGAVRDAAQLWRANFGWQAVLYPRGQMLLFNVPSAELNEAEQHVMNIQTGQWCRFTGMNAFCWGTLNGDLYFGGNTIVYKADSGESDNGSNIQADVQPAFSYFRTPWAQKRFTMARPIFQAGSRVNPNLMMNVDFSTAGPSQSVTSPGVTGTPWSSPWGSPWSAVTTAIRKQWYSITGIGFSGSLRIRVATDTQEIALLSIDYLYEQGGYL